MSALVNTTTSEVLAGDEGSGHGGGGRADVQDERLAARDHRGGGTADGGLFLGGGTHSIPRRNARGAAGGRDNGATVDPLETARVVEQVEIAAYRHFGDAEHRTQVGHADELSLSYEGEDLLPAEFCGNARSSHGHLTSGGSGSLRLLAFSCQVTSEHRRWVSDSQPVSDGDTVPRRTEGAGYG